MNNIFSVKEFDIYQDKRNSSFYKIVSKNNQNCSALFYSIIKNNIANSATIINSNNNNSSNNSLIIKTVSLKSFDQFKKEQKKKYNTYRMSYKVILDIILNLSKQLSYLLENEQKCFYTFDPDNVLVVDDCKFLYLSNEHLKDVKDDNLYIYSPIKKNNYYLSPELRKALSIPIIINYKTIFYSLGLLIVSSLLNETIDSDIHGKIMEKIVSIKGTKLYFFLERCFYNEPPKRFLIYL